MPRAWRAVSPQDSSAAIKCVSNPRHNRPCPTPAMPCRCPCLIMVWHISFLQGLPALRSAAARRVPRQCLRPVWLPGRHCLPPPLRGLLRGNWIGAVAAVGAAVGRAGRAGAVVLLPCPVLHARGVSEWAVCLVVLQAGRGPRRGYVGTVADDVEGAHAYYRHSVQCSVQCGVQCGVQCSRMAGGGCS